MLRRASRDAVRVARSGSSLHRPQLGEHHVGVDELARLRLRHGRLDLGVQSSPIFVVEVVATSPVVPWSSKRSAFELADSLRASFTRAKLASQPGRP
jgi:hypothetical protein